jgi:hypothetical protein
LRGGVIAQKDEKRVNPLSDGNIGFPASGTGVVRFSDPKRFLG